MGYLAHFSPSTRLLRYCCSPIIIRATSTARTRLQTHNPNYLIPRDSNKYLYRSSYSLHSRSPTSKCFFCFGSYLRSVVFRIFRVFCPSCGRHIHFTSKIYVASSLWSRNLCRSNYKTCEEEEGSARVGTVVEEGRAPLITYKSAVDSRVKYMCVSCPLVRVERAVLKPTYTWWINRYIFVFSAQVPPYMPCRSSSSIDFLNKPWSQVCKPLFSTSAIFSWLYYCLGLVSCMRGVPRSHSSSIVSRLICLACWLVVEHNEWCQNCARMNADPIS